jgi:predicted DNA binding CopG/RHH family protein/uncharacterized DUF497 family protein
MDFAATGFDWNHGNRDKCQSHGVSIAEIETIFRRSIALFPDLQHSKAEERFKAIGRSAAGRHILVAFTLRRRGEPSSFGLLVHAICTERKSSTMKSKKRKLRKLPVLKTDEEAEHFVATADLSEYDLSGMVPVRFEFKPKNERVNMRLSKGLLDSVKARAARAGMSYQRFIRETLERAVTQSKR